MMTLLSRIVFAGALAVGLPAAAQVNPDAFVQRDQLTHMTISPNGDYLAMTVPEEDQTGLVIIRRKDLSVSAAVKVGKNVHVMEDFRWVNPTKVLFHIAERYGALEMPYATGELVSAEAEGGKINVLVGYRAFGAATGTRLSEKTNEAVFASLVDDLPKDDRHVVISVSPFSVAPQSRAELMDVDTGKRTVIARVPVRRASFTTDHAGVVRFARGSGADNVSKLYYRDGRDAEWRLINDEAVSQHVESPLGFSRDDKQAYLITENASGTNSIVSFDPASGQRKELLRDPVVDPWSIISAFDDVDTPVGAQFMNGPARAAFFDPASPEARIYGGLAEAFPGKTVQITSTTSDGRLALLSVSSASDPGDYYVLDTHNGNAEHVFARRAVFQKMTMGEVRPIALKASDGTPLHGYLTLPPNSAGKNLPMVVMPHGGPIGIADEWGFNDDAQLLASAGYAVLQVNFRGSANYGREFMRAGKHEWGGRMQQDVTDATRWAIEQGVADGGRVCIYGASYGGYAALMGVASEPSLYRCAVGYVGVYDLPRVVDDLESTKSSETFGREWIGDDRAVLAAKSPTRLAAQIKVPVLLAAGGEDKTAPIIHSKEMEKALRAAGVPVETLYFDTEGHGFVVPAHRKEFYEKLLAFLAKNDGVRAQ